MQEDRVWDSLIIGAGAAGLAAATLCAQECPDATLLVESHLTPGGCAGYFARGFPRRIHDAGATQLIECAPGRLQHELLRLATGRSACDVMPVVYPIEAIEHVWPPMLFTCAGGAHAAQDSGATNHQFVQSKVRLDATGAVTDCGGAWARATLTESGRLALERFLAVCAADAALVWKLFYRFPDFPVRSWGGFIELLKLAPVLGLTGALRLTRCMGLSVADIAADFGLQEGTPEWQIVAALLLDTSQNTPAATPYLVGAMGLSILQRGIARLPDGMKGLFEPWLRGVRQSGVRIEMGTRVKQIRTRRDGAFEVDCQGHKSVTFYAKNVICALPIGSVLQLVEAEDVLTQSKEWKVWSAAVEREYEWQALALHGVAEGNCPPEFTGKPWYLQIFAQPGDDLEHALYVSMAPEAIDRRTGNPFRSFTASLHVDSTDSAKWRRSSGSGSSSKSELQRILRRRLEQGTGLSVTFSELATPETFARYTNRPQGRVGGFAASFNHFLFRSLPRMIKTRTHSGLYLAGDSVFPGQGVIAASMSGVLAWSAMSGKNPHVYLSELVKD